MMDLWRDLPFAPAAGTVLCGLGEIPDGAGIEVAFGEGAEAFRVLLLRRGDRVWAYRNRCPHFSIPLNYEPQKFWTFDGDTLMCAHHSALFRFENGHCFDGPCAGSHLQSIGIKVDGEKIRVF
jgi:nitrite reductase/ring-hydroxylating ferredoxin subunit